MPGPGHGLLLKLGNAHGAQDHRQDPPDEDEAFEPTGLGEDEDGDKESCRPAGRKGDEPVERYRWGVRQNDGEALVKGQRNDRLPQKRHGAERKGELSSEELGRR
jgi:hypothetical protein